MRPLILIGTILLVLPCCVTQENCLVTRTPSAPRGYQLRKLACFPQETVIDMQFVDAQTGFLLLQGESACCEIHKTENSGKDWTLIGTPDDCSRPRQIHFITPQKGYLICNDSVPAFFETVNGGQDWTRREFPEYPTRIQQLQPYENGDLYVKIAGPGYRSRFVKIENGYDSSKVILELGPNQGSILTIEKHRLYIFDPPEILIFDLEGNLLESKPVEGFQGSLHSFQIINDQDWILCTSRLLMRSSDGGQSWSALENNGFKPFRFDSPQEGLIVLDYNFCGDYPDWTHTFAYTMDGGDNWTESARIHGESNSVIEPCWLGPGRHVFFYESPFETSDLYELKKE